MEMETNWATAAARGCCSSDPLMASLAQPAKRQGRLSGERTLVGAEAVGAAEAATAAGAPAARTTGGSSLGGCCGEGPAQGIAGSTRRQLTAADDSPAIARSLEATVVWCVRG
jgi:hypothetical protein